MLKVKVLTVFPEMFPGFLGYSLTGKALEEQKWQLEAVNIRDYAFDKHKSVDDTPCGGGAGMIMRPDVLGRAIKANHTGGRIVYMSPKGRPLTQKLVREFSREEALTFVCGRFEGQAAQIMLDAIIRLLPGVLGNEASLEDESFEKELLEYPQYTRPIEWEGRSVPEILLSGHHQKIADWRKEQAEIATKARRPDLFKKYLDSKNS